MSNKVRDIYIDIINIENFDPNSIKIDEMSYKNILISYIGYVKIKDSKYAEIYSVNPRYLIFKNVCGCFEKINKSKYLTLVPTNKSQEKIKKYKEMWSKIRDLIRSITKTSDDYGKKCIKIKFN